MNEDTESAKRRRYYWHCSHCRAYVPREAEQCQCGTFKSERVLASEHTAIARPRTADAWRLILLVALSSVGLLWVLLD